MHYARKIAENNNLSHLHLTDKELDCLLIATNYNDEATILGLRGKQEVKPLQQQLTELRELVEQLIDWKNS